ncbi:hypothetical protein ASE17_14165 [Phenylobacterium sp. Root77]|jgi:hypothetical protein|uniref:hypothetical protein n=1 Tax=unclassified Phenylobacterium TaxID=2640670 RepID=UPI0006F84FF9|nr:MULTISPECIES: hypothetical protein [unclassified Phenylobacterium]KQW65954.1 hypothetical protein ASC73_19735 [Phenylobacterium sp. Root1277]KQW95663.1 hypothetical protein ASC79_08215 [Phenylobacterium sp. Root1290]KRC41452.1 hypothetical protein ASE17_14165 [Phenylobacterium sp. Root77]
MLFKAPVLKAIAEGKVDLAFRRWRKPTVKAGGTLHTPAGLLAIDEVAIIAAEAVTDADAIRAGYASRAAALAALEGEAPIHRIAFRRTGEDPRKALRLDVSEAALTEVEAQLARLDARAPWTAVVLDLIAANPGVRAPDLAARLRRDTAPFKTDVRKLKALGLTESLEVGYRLSPRGEAVRTRRLQARSPDAKPQA